MSNVTRIVALHCSIRRCFSVGNHSRHHSSASCPIEDATNVTNKVKTTGKWLPPFPKSVSASASGKCLSISIPAEEARPTASTARKWVFHCCPDLPKCLIYKLFRSRQVRRVAANSSDEADEHRRKRVKAKDILNVGDRIFLPIVDYGLHLEKKQREYNEEDLKFVCSLELYKDPAIIVLNKPSGMPVQGGTGIMRSLDELAAACLCHNYLEPPRLVHRLDKDASGILVMARTKTAATFLHSIFLEKTLAASNGEDISSNRRVLQKSYWALVIGFPKCSKGLISAPLGKMVLSRKSDGVMIAENENMDHKHAVTQYRVIKSCTGYTWLELIPLTGRKHQLRVHCARVLGTPVVGDYKYGWQAHRKRDVPYFPTQSHSKKKKNKGHKGRKLYFGLDFERGCVVDPHPRLHLHCNRMVLPNVARVLQGTLDVGPLQTLQLDAPLPPHMQRSWNLLTSH